MVVSIREQILRKVWIGVLLLMSVASVGLLLAAIGARQRPVQASVESPESGSALTSLEAQPLVKSSAPGSPLPAADAVQFDFTEKQILRMR